MHNMRSCNFAHFNPGNKLSTVEALISGHPQVAKKVSITGAGHLRECENTEFVWEFNKMGL